MEEPILEKPNEVINFTNIDKEDFEGQWGGEITIIGAGATLPFPRFLALHYTKHLVNKILLRDMPEKDSSDESLRKPLEDKILVGVPQPVQAEVPAEETKSAEPEFAEAPKEETASTTPDITSDDPVALGFKCEVCGKEFKARIGLAGHQRSHKK